MILAAILAAVIATAAPSASPSGDTVALATSPTVAESSKPCAHRIFCGPVRLLPRDSVERKAFVANAVLTIADGLVSSAGYRRFERTCLTCKMAAGHARYANFRNVTPRDLTAWPTEGNPIMRPWSHGGFSTLMLGWTLGEISGSYMTRSWSPHQRTLAAVASAASHVQGIASWQAENVFLGRLEHAADVCNQLWSMNVAAFASGDMAAIERIHPAFLKCNALAGFRS